MESEITIDALPAEILASIVSRLDELTSMRFMLTCYRHADACLGRDATAADVIAYCQHMYAKYTCRCGRRGIDVSRGICPECMPSTTRCEECGRRNFPEFFQHVKYNRVMRQVYGYLKYSVVCHRDIGCRFACKHCGEIRPCINQILANTAGDVYCKDCVHGDPSLQQQLFYHMEYHEVADTEAVFSDPKWYTYDPRKHSGVRGCDASRSVDPAADRYGKYARTYNMLHWHNECI